MTMHPIDETTATGDEIHAIVQAIEPALINVKRSHAIISCLSIAIVLMNPDVTPEEIQEGVKGCSQWICLYLDGKGGESAPLITLN